MSKPKNIRKWIKGIDTKKIRIEVESIVDSTDEIVDIWLYIDSSASGHASAAVRNLFLTSSSNVRVQITYFDKLPENLNSGSDFAIIVAGQSSSVVSLTKKLQGLLVPTFIVVDDVESFCTSVPQEDLAALDGDYWAYDSESKTRTVDLQARLARWIIAVCPDKKMSLGYAFRFIARPIATDAITMTAFENALSSLVPFVRSADSTFFVINQIVLLAQISTIYRKELSCDLIKEIVGVLFASSLANKAINVTSDILPLPKFLVRSASNFLLTKVIGEALVEYFEGGGDILGIAKIIERADAEKKKLSNRFTEIKATS